jgi:hypothetical protein
MEKKTHLNVKPTELLRRVFIQPKEVSIVEQTLAKEQNFAYCHVKCPAPPV